MRRQPDFYITGPGNANLWLDVQEGDGAFVVGECPAYISGDIVSNQKVGLFGTPYWLDDWDIEGGGDDIVVTIKLRKIPAQIDGEMKGPSDE